MSGVVRVIPCLDVDAGRVVKGVNFANLRDAGDPCELARLYCEQGADEITFLDITATTSGRETLVDLVRRTASVVSVPLAVGGGVRSVADAERLLAAGAAKVGVNTAAVLRPALISEIADAFGPSVVVLALDARGIGGFASGFEVVTHGGREGAGIDAVEWAQRGAALGAGEILLTSLDADGMTTGFDVAQIGAVSSAVSVPVTASGGAGKVSDFVAAVEAGASAVLAASVFHFGVLTVGAVKEALVKAGYKVL